LIAFASWHCSNSSQEDVCGEDILLDTWDEVPAAANTAGMVACPDNCWEGAAATWGPSRNFNRRNYPEFVQATAPSTLSPPKILVNIFHANPVPGKIF